MSSSEAEEVPGIVLTKPVSRVDDEGNVVFKPSREFLLAFSSLCALCIAVAFDATTLSVALPNISSAIGGTALQAFWSGTSFLLSSTVFQPTFASLSGIFGRKYLIYVCSVFFAVGSLVAAVAKNFTVIIVGRTIQGTGGGGLIALTEVIVTDLVPLEVRGQWFSLLSAMWAIGTVTGPLIGAGFAQNISWRWIFWINLPVIGLGVILIFFFLNQAKVPGQVMQKLRRVDWVGASLFTIGSTSFLFGISTGGVMYEWSSFRTLLPMILGFFIMVAFAFWILKFAKEPLIDPGIFNNWDMIATYIMTIFHGMILWSLLYCLTLYYQAVKFYSPITSALAVLPETLTVAPAGIFVGITVTMTGHYRWSVWAGWFLTTLGAGIMYLLDPQTTVVQWIFLNIPIGLGTGMLFPAMGLSIQAACDPKLNDQAAAFFSFLRTFGQSIGVAISGVIFQNAFEDKLLATVFFKDQSKDLSRDATIVVEVIKHMQAGEERNELVKAYADALRIVWVALLAFSAAGMLISVTIKGYSLKQEHISKQALEPSARQVAKDNAERDAEKAAVPRTIDEKAADTNGSDTEKTNI